MTDHDTEDAYSAPRIQGWLTPAVFIVAAMCILPELLLQAADLRLVGSPLWRSLAYQNGAFWPGLLHGWQPNYPTQPLTMFFTYAFLHGGFGHLTGNMVTLLVLGRAIVGRIGQKGFLLIYVAAVLGGAAAFGAMAPSPQPMVGASGALFGLVGAWQYWDYADPLRRHRRLWRLARGVGFLVALHAILWVLLDGLLAWQTHLGGYLVGWLAAATMQLRGDRSRSQF